MFTCKISVYSVIRPIVLFKAKGPNVGGIWR